MKRRKKETKILFSTIVDAKNGIVGVGIDNVQNQLHSSLGNQHSLANHANLTTYVASNEPFWFLYTLGNATLNIYYDTYPNRQKREEGGTWGRGTNW